MRDDAQILRSAAWARFYRARGLNPLPSRADRKRPAMATYAEERDGGFPEELMASWWGPNVQVATGGPWGLAVVDVDGGVASDWFDAACSLWGCPPTWKVESGGSTWDQPRYHYWFAVDASRPWPKRMLWCVPEPGKKGSVVGRANTKVEFIGDKSLIVAPPSIHPGTGRPYRFVVGPDDLPAPAPLPGWIARCPGIAQPRQSAVVVGPAPFVRAAPFRPGRLPRYDNAAVISAMSRAEALVPEAQKWGLVTSGDGPNVAGWWPCHSVFRRDSDPSCSISVRSGAYAEGDSRAVVRYFDLAVQLGAYSRWQDACDHLGSVYLGVHN